MNEHEKKKLDILRITETRKKGQGEIRHLLKYI